MNRKVRTFALVVVLVLAVAFLTGCTMPQGEVDLNNPQGLWEMLVFAIAKLLIFLNDTIERVGIPYSWGLAIIILTIGIKLVTLPLTRKQLESTRKTQELQPKLKELQLKYGKDRQKLSEEQMKLYKEAGVNPLGGCLPLLIQLPILWALYQSLYVLASPSVNELSGAPFFWIPDLAFPSLAVGTKWIGESFQAQEWAILFAYFSLPVLMIVTQLVQQKMSQPPKAAQGATGDSQSRMMGQMMMFMPVMFGYITLGLPSGLTLYWTVSNILGIIQQYFVTGWGALVDWIPSLDRKRKAEVLESASTAPAAPATTSKAPEKPVKRRRRRK